MRRARWALGALLAADVACSAAQVVASVLARPGSRAPLAATAAISAVGVGSAAPVLLRAMRRVGRRDATRALRTVGAGLAFHTAGCAAVLPTARGRQRLLVAAVLAGGDVITLGYRRELRRLVRR
ncbi:hypothetical protein GCM10009846_00640 [Agrococcus versicolor]|uniref:Lipoprotein n=1 Tax=Agrococcus versicolor TaxID=501482 RepID=A0ABN3AJ15_9MICO